MQRQTVVIEWVGEMPSKEHQVAATIEFLNSLARNGVYVDATVDPSISHFTEKDIAGISAVVAKNNKSRGITIKVEKPDAPKIVLTKDKEEKIREFLESMFNG